MHREHAFTLLSLDFMQMPSFNITNAVNTKRLQISFNVSHSSEIRVQYKCLNILRCTYIYMLLCSRESVFLQQI